jgi:hypothetical protein
MSGTNTSKINIPNRIKRRPLDLPLFLVFFLGIIFL